MLQLAEIFSSILRKRTVVRHGKGNKTQKKKAQLKGFGESMKGKMSNDSDYRDFMINSFKERGEAQA